MFYNTVINTFPNIWEATSKNHCFRVILTTKIVQGQGTSQCSPHPTRAELKGLHLPLNEPYARVISQRIKDTIPTTQASWMCLNNTETNPKAGKQLSLTAHSYLTAMTRLELLPDYLPPHTIPLSAGRATASPPSTTQQLKFHMLIVGIKRVGKL